MSYIDGFVVPVVAAKKEAYLAMAIEGAALFMECGAIRMVENWGEDVPRGQQTDFWMAVKAEPTEHIVFSWIEWPSKADRDIGMARAMADPRMKAWDMPFDGKRMITGGFTTLFDSASV